ncbi:MAG: helix-turn-helix transcriptional regulator [bacterium]|nr:helix-turn-helix transcriptional regulator [bacterium]
MTTPPDRERRPLDWARWMRGLGRQVQRLREFLGLSQEQLARLAGVSQGAISRLENGRGLATPLLVVLKVNEALRAGLSRLDPAHLSPEARRVVELTAGLASDSGDFASYTPAADPRSEELLKLYRSVPDRLRDQLLSIVRATATALRDSPAPSPRPDHDDATG